MKDILTGCFGVLFICLSAWSFRPIDYDNNKIKRPKEFWIVTIFAFIGIVILSL